MLFFWESMIFFPGISSFISVWWIAVAAKWWPIFKDYQIVIKKNNFWTRGLYFSKESTENWTLLKYGGNMKEIFTNALFWLVRKDSQIKKAVKKFILIRILFWCSESWKSLFRASNFRTFLQNKSPNSVEKYTVQLTW